MPETGADIATRSRQLRFRAGHRGLRELDLYFEAFLAVHLDRFGAGDLDQLEAILDIPDQEVLTWVLGQAQPPAEMQSRVLDLLLSFRYAAHVKQDIG